MRNRLHLEWQIFLLAVQFLTRLPVPHDLPWSDDLAVRATKFYPAVGALVGLLGGAVLWGGALIWPVPVAVLLSLAGTLILTGGLHEDGLADAADGLLGGAGRDRALDIMRDSRLGSYGALALVTALGLKLVLLSGLSAAQGAVLLVAGHALGRMGAVHVIATTVYARAAPSKFATPMVTPDGYRYALTTALVLLIPLTLTLGAWPMLTGVALAIAMAQAFRRYFVARLGGYTGDCLGATVILSELGLYLGVIAWL